MNRLRILLAPVILAVLVGVANGQCVNGVCRPSPFSQVQAPEVAQGPPNIVRVTSTVDGSTGTGTIVDDDGTTAIVLSCAHLFEAGTGTAIVSGAWGQATSTFTTIDRDRADISAITIPSPGVAVIPVAETMPSVGSPVTASGYGGGSYRSFTGAIANVTGTEFRIRGLNRQGDSGGPMLNASGELVGVQWGNNLTSTTIGTCCRPIRAFLQRVRDKIGFRRRPPPILPGPGPEQPQPETAPEPPHQPQPVPPDLEWKPVTPPSKPPAPEQTPEPTPPPTGPTEPASDPGDISADERPEHDSSPKGSSFDWMGMLFGAAQAAAYLGLGTVAVGTGAGVPVGGAMLAWKGAKAFARWRRKRRKSKPVGVPAYDASAVRGQEVEKTVVLESPTVVQRHLETRFVDVPSDDYQRAHEEARAHMARKYPGCQEILETELNMVHQFLAGTE